MNTGAGRTVAFCDTLSEGLLYGMIVFSPWAFGTTQPWSVWTMNVAGYALGLLWAGKWVWRRTHPAAQPEAPPRSASRLTRALAVLTVLFLGYCLVSVLNARATFADTTGEFTYRSCKAWLPHSYDRPRSLQALWNYLALALTFWAARDWLSAEAGWRPAGSDEAEQRAWRHGLILPPRWRRLLWVLCLNGGLLAVECLVQRASGTNRLLWLVEPGIHKDPEQQLGPYAYRSNAAQYFAMTWPLALAFWWMLQIGPTDRARSRGIRHRHLLLSCALAMATCPLLSHSRAGVLVGVGGLGVAGIILVRAGRLADGRWLAGILVLLGGAACLGLGASWETVVVRMQRMVPEFIEMRWSIYRPAWQMAQEFPLFGTGPDTFESVFLLYRTNGDDFWAAQAHCDWLELWITLGAVGFSMLLAALGLVLLRWRQPGGVVVHRVFVWFLWLAVGGCVLHSTVDFPFTIYSLLFLFLLLCAMLFCLSGRPGMGGSPRGPTGPALN